MSGIVVREEYWMYVPQDCKAFSPVSPSMEALQVWMSGQMATRCLAHRAVVNGLMGYTGSNCRPETNGLCLETCALNTFIGDLEEALSVFLCPLKEKPRYDWIAVSQGTVGIQKSSGIFSASEGNPDDSSGAFLVL